MNLLEARSEGGDPGTITAAVPPAMPPLCRTPLAPSHLLHRSSVRRPWERTLFWRRSILAVLVLAPSAVMAWLFAGALPPPRGDTLTLALAAAFGLLFAWVAVWFWTATAGFLTLLSARDGTAPADTGQTSSGARPEQARVAVIMPAYHEDPALGSKACARTL
jgi:membrane glycosyltransferase